MFLEWDESYSVKISKFDNAHQHLIQLINTIHDNLNSGKDIEITKNVLVDLKKYTQTHFEEEIALLQTYNYPDLDDHEKEHSNFISELDSLQLKLKTNSNLLNIQILYFLKDWLTNHILNTDKRYSEYFVKNGITGNS